MARRRPNVPAARADAPTSPPTETTPAAASAPPPGPIATSTPTRATRKRDLRCWIYGGLDLLFAAVFAFAIAKVVPNRLLSGSIHMWLIPIATLVGGVGMLLGKKLGWQLALGGGSAVLLLTILLIARMLISAAFLAGVYGAFGKGAATFAIVAVALVIELVALLPIVQVKFLMSRAGRRAFGVAPLPAPAQA
jgi:hypothetical protein